MSVRLIKDVSLEGIIPHLRQMMQEGKLDPLVRRLAEEAIFAREDPVRGVYDWVREHLPYVSDPEPAELFIHPRRIAEDYYAGRARAGDCDDAALLVSAMLGSIGYVSRIALLATGDTQEIDHAVAEVFSPELNSWLIIDPTAKSFPLGWIEASRRTIPVE